MGAFKGGHVWSEITPLVRSCRRRRRVAVAYLGADAPRLLPLRRGDQLIVGATVANARAGAINPDSLSHYVEAGVRVMAHPWLHAKVMRLGDVTIVGSANASPTSERLQEAVIISRSVVVASDVDRFIDELERDSIDVDDTLVASLRRAWQERTRRGAPGVADNPDADLWPRSDARLFVYDSEDRPWTRSALQTRDANRRRWRRHAGSRWSADALLIGRDEFRAARPGDLIVFRHLEDSGETFVYPPSEILGEPVTIPRSSSRLLPLRHPDWIDPVEDDEFDRELRERINKPIGGPRRVRDAAMRDAILDVFRLPRRPE